MYHIKVCADRITYYDFDKDDYGYKFLKTRSNCARLIR